MIRKYESEGTWPNRSLIEIFDEVVGRTPDKIAIVGPDARRMTYAQVAEKVHRIAGNLADAGVQARDVISLQLPNWPEFVLAHLAATRLKIIERERCTFTLAATPFASMLLECPTLDQYDLSSFRIFGCAGAPIPQKLGDAFRQRIGCTLIGMWGMTECFVGSASPPDDRTEKLWETDGKAMPGAELAIFDATRSKRVPPGGVGELATRGPHVCLGYFNDRERTRDTFSDDGWLFSNDLATMDAEGYIRLVGRKKDVINRGGLKVSVREVEELLLQHPGIVCVALIAVPDERLGEKGCAFVVPRDNAQLALRELVRYLEEKGVAKYKLPEYLVVVQEFPMTPSGKIQKFKLREDFVDGKYLLQRSAVS